MPRLIPFASLQAMPWKNGGGSTTEILVWPAGASLDTFEWRISIATIASDGPFSIFPGIDRTLSLLSGQGVDLQIAGQTNVDERVEKSVALRPAQPTLAFPGEWRIQASLPDGPTRDFNVMTRRSVCRHTFARLQACTTYTRQHPLGLLVLTSPGPVLWQDGQTEFVMQQFDSVFLQAVDAMSWQARRVPDGAPDWFMVEIAPATGDQHELG